MLVLLTNMKYEICSLYVCWILAAETLESWDESLSSKISNYRLPFLQFSCYHTFKVLYELLRISSVSECALFIRVKAHDITSRVNSNTSYLRSPNRRERTLHYVSIHSAQPIVFQCSIFVYFVWRILSFFSHHFSSSNIWFRKLYHTKIEYHECSKMTKLSIPGGNIFRAKWTMNKRIYQLHNAKT